MDGYKGFQTFRQIGIAGFEPTTSPSQGERSTKLSHIPSCLTVSCHRQANAKPNLRRQGVLPWSSLCSIFYFQI